ncbi:pentatricopeptide repeat-containing protein At3g49170, chloroplastic [Nicotiana sylvestris]|uniref:Pentatricopeptide repeat-containing protein At3g49170, chloroplastic isoform X1 n=1 Tax=Nicotiana sylvestris TaxID=4096 RepID=A0A1U7V352_NICSY|nr:PREDICTED: pentatricopeptide repeat-containing protein At3g49170, chloroplastic isoform X1 [Nicotiana sylvestris]
MITLSLPSPAKLIPPSPKNLTSLQIHRRNPNFEALKDRLIRQANVGNLKQAISTLDHISQMGLTPDLTSYTVLLKSCIRTRNFQLGELLHSKLNNSSLEPDTIVLNSLISLYAKMGDWETAKMIFENMGEKRDLVSWSAMISCFAHCGMELEAVLTFFDMVEFGEYPNQFCFSAVIQACCSGEFGWIGLVIFGFVVKTGYFESDICVGCALIDLFAKGFCDLRSAKQVFDRMPERNLVTWTLMITRFSQLGADRDAVGLFLEMVSEGFVPDRFTFSGVLSACAQMGLSSFGRQLHGWVVKSRLSSDVCVGCSLVDMYAKCTMDGSMNDSRKVFDQMADHNVMSWTAIITGYVQSGCYDMEAIKLYCRMIEGPVKPNHFTFSSLLKACGNLSNLAVGEQIYNHAVKLGLASVNCVANSLISMYAKSGRMEEARKAFELLFEKNLVSYNIIVDGYSKNLDSTEAFELFSQIDSEVGIDAFTFASLLSGAASIGAVGKGEQIHARVLKAGIHSNQSVCNALISMYSRCGNIEAASQVFERMEDRNVISWTSIITGFAKHGFAYRALELFNQMLGAGIKPNEITYIAVLSACSHVGLVEEGWKYFDSMSSDHRITPRMEHYACMVDLLSRSGSLEKAVQFIKSLPLNVDALVWRTLLGACQVYGNLQLGKYAAEMILEQEPNDPAAHVLLSNLYASRGEWEEVAKIRKDMKEKRLVKEAGCSWIEAENSVHRFYVGDTNHPRAKEIYEKLDKVALKIKEIGYVPNTDLVLHEVEDEQKEQYLFQHSEKIALAFGLISTSKSKPIRIFKNLRVCGDCHNAMKFISVAEGREIIVRDSNRFHHIKDGLCSCNDYW